MSASFPGKGKKTLTPEEQKLLGEKKLKEELLQKLKEHIAKKEAELLKIYEQIKKDNKDIIVIFNNFHKQFEELLKLAQNMGLQDNDPDVKQQIYQYGLRILQKLADNFGSVFVKENVSIPKEVPIFKDMGAFIEENLKKRELEVQDVYVN